jgi:hypothetical protein
MMDEVMELLEKCGATRTSGALQLELDVIGSLKYQIKYKAGSAGRAQVGARIAELGQNPSVRTNPWSLVVGSLYPKLLMLIGAIPQAWAGGKKVDGDSVLKGMRLWHNQAMPLMQSACDNAVGARKVILIAQIIIQCAHLCRCETDSNALIVEGIFHVYQASGFVRLSVYVHSAYHGGERRAVPSRY